MNTNTLNYPRDYGDSDTSDCQTKLHTSTHFMNCPIQDIFKLGRADFIETARPLKSHIHPNCFEVCYHYRGLQTYVIGDHSYQTKSGEIFLTYPNEEHGTGNAPEEKSSLYYLVFHCMPDTENFMGLCKQDSDWIKKILWSCKKRNFLGKEEMRFLLTDILNLYFSGNPMRESRIRALFIRFFYLLCQCVLDSQKEARLYIPEDMQMICDYIEEHPHENYCVEELARQIFLSGSQFKRKFKQYTGFSPYDYIIRQKVLCAQEMMQYTYMTITQISNEPSFSSSQHFATVFKRYTGMTPREYRQNVLHR